MRVRSTQGSSDLVAAGAGPAPVSGVARAVRIGGQSLSPGEARVFSLAVPPGSEPADAIPLWVAVSRRPGPRVTVVGAPRGFEIVAARAVSALRAGVDTTALNGAIVAVPVLRPGGRFAAGGQPIPDGVAWRFPGDPGGNRRARAAFAVFSELAVGSSVLVIVTAPDPGRAGMLTVSGDLQDPRVRRLSACAGAGVIIGAKPAAGTLGAAASDMGAVVLQVAAPTDMSGDDVVLAALEGLLTAAGVLSPPAGRAPPPPVPPPTVTQTTVVRAPQGGLVEWLVTAGQAVERGALLARIAPPLAGRAADVRSPHDALVLEAGTRSGARARGPLFLLGRLGAAAVARHTKQHRNGADAAASSLATPVAAAPASGHPPAPDAPLLHVGWVESISLPGLGVSRLRAKIDTGARTSALHVTRMKTVGTTDGPHQRPILELTLPAGSRRGARPVVVRVLVRDYVHVKDTSGRSERRPVIETTLRLGTLERRIRVTLTNRGDMLFPMLIGRTALGPGVVVDPGRRLLHPRRSPRRIRSES
ncbi:MAG: RimK/LysX family protein [Bacteroidota bacterium]